MSKSKIFLITIGVITAISIAAGLKISAESESFSPKTVDGFDYPVGTPISQGGAGYVSALNDGDGYYDAQDFTVNGHCGEDWNGEGGGNTDYGDPVFSIADGVVTAAGDYGSSWGNIITIEHYIQGATDPNYEIIESQYAHLICRSIKGSDFC